MSEPKHVGSDAWMLEQQTRAEFEADGWRKLRAEVAQKEAQVAAAQARAMARARVDDGEIVSNSATLKALARFMFATLGAYIAFIAVATSNGGAFDRWFAVGAGFVVTLACTMFGPLRQLVHVIAETARWVLLLGLGVGVVYALVQFSAFR